MNKDKKKEGKAQRVVIIVQARMGATRLPGKPLKLVSGRPLLSYLVERLRRVKRAALVAVATTSAKQDQQIIDFCIQEHIPFFVGSETDVLERYYQAAQRFNADVIVRVTGDCPLIDPEEVDRVIACFQSQQPPCDYASNSMEKKFLRGVDTEVFSFHCLERTYHEANKQAEREHVTPYIYLHPEQFSLVSAKQPSEWADYRLTVDTPEDFELVSKILETLYPSNPAFLTHDVMALLSQHPAWATINADIKQKPLGL